MIESKTYFKSIAYFIRCNKTLLQLGEKGKLSIHALKALLERNGIIIWENQGIFKLIPNSILRNVWTNFNAAQQIKENYPLTTEPRKLKEISWNQGIPISPIVVKNLLIIDNSGNESSNTDTATRSDSKD